MVLRCFLCKTTYNKTEKDVQMHKVPENKHIRKLWLSVLNITHINRNARLCSKHFNEQDFVISLVRGTKYVKPDAVPSINLQQNEGNTVGYHFEKGNIKSEVVAKHCNKKHDTSLKRSLTVETTEDEVARNNIRTFCDIDIEQVSQSHEGNTVGCHFEEENIKSEVIAKHCNKKHDTSLKRSLTVEETTEDKVPRKNIRTFRDIDIKQVSQSPTEAKACLEALIEELQEKRKEVKRFRDKARKLEKKVNDLRSLIKTLKDKKLITALLKKFDRI